MTKEYKNMPIIRKKSVAGDCSLNVNENNNFYVVIECLETQIKKVIDAFETATLDEIYEYFDYVYNAFNNFAYCFLKDFDLSDTAKVNAAWNYFTSENRFWFDAKPTNLGWAAMNKNPNLTTQENFDARMYWRDYSYIIGFNKIIEALWNNVSK